MKHRLYLLYSYICGTPMKEGSSCHPFHYSGLSCPREILCPEDFSVLKYLKCRLCCYGQAVTKHWTWRLLPKTSSHQTSPFIPQPYKSFCYNRNAHWYNLWFAFIWKSFQKRCYRKLVKTFWPVRIHRITASIGNVWNKKTNKQKKTFYNIQVKCKTDKIIL